MALPFMRPPAINKPKHWLIRTVFLPLAAFCTVYLVALVTHYFLPGCQSPVIAASIGASAVIVFMNPGSPYSSAWSLIAGHLVSALIGISSAISIPDIALSSAVAVSGSMLMMGQLRCMNPPGAATALAPVLSPPVTDSWQYYSLLPSLMLNVVVLAVISASINKFLRVLH